MDPGERSDDHSDTSQMAGLHRGMLAARSLAVVFIPEHHPMSIFVFVITGNDRKRLLLLTGQEIHPMPRLFSEFIHRPDKEVVADMIEMPPKSKPRPRRGNVIRRAFPFRLGKDQEILKIVSL